jgi:hypothetical protein
MPEVAAGAISGSAEVDDAFAGEYRSKLIKDVIDESLALHAREQGAPCGDARDGVYDEIAPRMLNRGDTRSLLREWSRNGT